MRAVVTDLDRHALGGRAVRKQVTLYLNGSEQGPQTSVLLYLPAGAKAPAPLFVGLNFHGNQAVAANPAIAIAHSWVAAPGKDRKSTRLNSSHKCAYRMPSSA